MKSGAGIWWLLSITMVFAGCAERAQREAPIRIDPAFRQDTIDYLQRLEQQGFSAGLLIAQGDRALIHTGIGIADRSSSRAWSRDTISTMGSITKQFTGAAILTLQEDGLLDTSDPIMKYFADVAEDKRAITLHHLLAHSSGLVDPAIGDWDPVEREDYVRLALAQPLAFAPGSGYAYSNAGYSLLGAIIEQISGVTYEAYVRERLWLPAGMTETGYLLPDWDESHVAVGYRGTERWGTVLERPMADDGPYWALRANGGVHSTTGDMWAWARALIDGTALRPASMAAYWAPHVDEGHGDSYYGYGWVVIEQSGYRVITHNGGNGIFFADMAIIPEHQVVMVMQTNVASTWPRADRLLEIIWRRMFDQEPYPAASS